MQFAGIASHDCKAGDTVYYDVEGKITNVVHDMASAKSVYEFTEVPKREDLLIHKAKLRPYQKEFLGCIANKEANKLLFSDKVYTALKNHPKIIAKLERYSKPELPSYTFSVDTTKIETAKKVAQTFYDTPQSYNCRCVDTPITDREHQLLKMFDYEYGFDAEGKFFMRDKGDKKMSKERVRFNCGEYKIEGEVHNVETSVGIHGQRSAKVDLENVEVVKDQLPPPPKPRKLVQKLEHEVFWNQQSVLKTFSLPEALKRYNDLVRAAAALQRAGSTQGIAHLKSGSVLTDK